MQRNASPIHFRLRTVIGAALLGLVLGQQACTEATPQAKLIAQGMAAVRSGDYQSADDDFRDAVERSGPGAYREIGAAEAASSGRELRAVCWFAAYLAAEPQAPDAAQTRETIAQLMKQRREKTLQLIQRFAELGPPPPVPPGAAITNPYLQAPNWDNGPTRAQEAHEDVLRDLAYRWDTIGDFDAARRVTGMMGAIGWVGSKSDACTTLVRAESDEAVRRYEAGDIDGSARLLADAEKDDATTFPGIYPDEDRPYGIAMAQLRIARDLAAKGKFDEARQLIATTTDNPENETNEETKGSIATTKIVLARAQLKAGDGEGARATLVDAARIALTINKPGEALKLETLRDLADAETEAGDLDGARAALTAAVPLVVIYNDVDHARLEIVTAQLKAGDKDGAQKTAARMTDPDLKAKARQEIATPPAPPKPGDQSPFPPFPSQYLAAMPPGEPPHNVVEVAQWMNLLELNLDAPCFTAFPYDSDVIAIAQAIQQEPVRRDRQAPVPDLPTALEIVSRRMIAAQMVVERLRKTQFGP